MKKIFAILIVIFSCFHIVLANEYNRSIMKDGFELIGEVTVYSYDLIKATPGVFVYQIQSYDYVDNCYSEKLITDTGITVKKLRHKKTGEIIYRETPFEVDEIFTIDGKKVIVETAYNADLNNIEYSFFTNEGEKVEQVDRFRWLYTDDTIDGRKLIGYIVYDYYIEGTLQYHQYDISSHWGKESIYNVTELELIDDISPRAFFPDAPMTRDVFVTALARYSGIIENEVDWAINVGLLQGYGNGDYGLYDTITREQMAVFFERYLNIMGYDKNAMKTVTRSTFSDEWAMSDWAMESVYVMQEMALIKGKPGNAFDPQGLTTRAEGATVLYNLIQATENLSVSVTPDYSGVTDAEEINVPLTRAEFCKIVVDSLGLSKDDSDAYKTYVDGMFSDISKNDSYYDSIVTMYEYGLMNGTGATTFEPFGSITKAEIATVLSRVVEAKGGPAINTSSSNEYWYSAYVEYAMAYNLVNSTSDWDAVANTNDINLEGLTAILGNSFGDYADEKVDYANMENRPLTRAFVSELIVDVFGLSKYDSNAEYEYVPGLLVDISESDSYYDAVVTMYEHGIMRGDQGNYKPSEVMTKSEVAVALYRAAIQKGATSSMGNYVDDLSEIGKSWSMEWYAQFARYVISHNLMNCTTGWEEDAYLDDINFEGIANLVN